MCCFFEVGNSDSRIASSDQCKPDLSPSYGCKSTYIVLMNIAWSAKRCKLCTLIITMVVSFEVKIGQDFTVRNNGSFEYNVQLKSDIL